MARTRIRTIKPEIWTSLQFIDLSREARLCFIALISLADDAGRGSADARKLKVTAYAADNDIRPQELNELLKEIEAQGLIRTYDGGPTGRLYVLPTWFNHQVISKPKASAYPEPPEDLVAPEYLTKARALQQPTDAKNPGHVPDTSETRPLPIPDASKTRPRGSDPKGSDPIVRADRIGSRSALTQNGASPAPGATTAAPAPRLKKPPENESLAERLERENRNNTAEPNPVQQQKPTAEPPAPPKTPAPLAKRAPPTPPAPDPLHALLRMGRRY